jgi:hypothetical protein
MDESGLFLHFFTKKERKVTERDVSSAFSVLGSAFWGWGGKRA